MPNQTSEKLGKLLSFCDETLTIERCSHKCDEESILEENYSLLKALPEQLEIGVLLTRFSVETRKLIPCDAIEYNGVESSLYYIDGETEKHQCQYGLRYLNINLGEIKFYRGESFSVDELEMLEIMISGLIQPLQNTINHHLLSLHCKNNSKLESGVDTPSIMMTKTQTGKES